MNLAIIGTGYVGLVTGTCFAETGNNVICIDIDDSKVRAMQKGVVPIYEPGLNVIFERNTKQGRLTFTTSMEEGIKDAEIIFLALPTPADNDGSADLSFILNVTEQLAGMINTYKVIVDKSTVPVGTAEKVHATLSQHLSNDLFDVVSNPEFLREGVAVDDFLKPDRVIIGTSSDKARNIMKQLYQPFVRQGNPIIFMDERSAEMTKYAANSYLATRITFMNEIANLCERVGANVDMVRKGMGSDTRIGKRFLFPGIGYGGSCFPKDVQALSKTASENDYDFKLINSVISINDKQKIRLVEKIESYYKGNLAGKKFGVWGLSFKPNTDDIREAPALYIIKSLLSKGAQIIAFDPEAIENTQAYLGDKIVYAPNLYDAVEGTDALIICTEWAVFRSPDFNLLRQKMKSQVIFDGRNVFDPDLLDGAGFYYESIGRPIVKE